MQASNIFTVCIVSIELTFEKFAQDQFDFWFAYCALSKIAVMSSDDCNQLIIVTNGNS